MRKLKLIACLVMGMLFATLQSMAGEYIFEPSDFFGSLKEGDKAAILMIHFGTTHDDTRALTIDAVNKKVTEAFPGVEVREAYTSRIVIKRLGDRGIEKLTPKQALLKLKLDGYTHVLIQPTTMTNGVEMQSIHADTHAVKKLFKELRVATPLLFYDEDYDKVIDILTKDNNKKDMAYLWVGHGTYYVSTAQNAMLDYKFQDKGFNNHVVGCIEGYPYFEQALKRLKALKVKKVKVMPFMLVGGEHAKNDIAEDWKNDLEKAGYKVELDLRGLGENPDIQDRFVDILKFYAKNRRLLIMEKKNAYKVTGEKRMK